MFRGSHTSVADDVGLDCCIVKKFLWVTLRPIECSTRDRQLGGARVCTNPQAGHGHPDEAICCPTGRSPPSPLGYEPPGVEVNAAIAPRRRRVRPQRRAVQVADLWHRSTRTARLLSSICADMQEQVTETID